jgi:hypothetical protein
MVNQNKGNSGVAEPAELGDASLCGAVEHLESHKTNNVTALGQVTLLLPVSGCRISWILSPTSVTFSMTNNTKRNQVAHHIVTELAPTFHVMDL